MGQWWSSQWGIATSGNVINIITSPIKSRHIPYGCIELLLKAIPSASPSPSAQGFGSLSAGPSIGHRQS